MGSRIAILLIPMACDPSAYSSTIGNKDREVAGVSPMKCRRRHKVDELFLGGHARLRPWDRDIWLAKASRSKSSVRSRSAA